jgi:hypothetical protein
MLPQLPRGGWPGRIVPLALLAAAVDRIEAQTALPVECSVCPLEGCTAADPCTVCVDPNGHGGDGQCHTGGGYDTPTECEGLGRLAGHIWCSPYNMVSSGTCESHGYSTIVGIDRCAAAVHAHKNLDGDAGPDNLACCEGLSSNQFGPGSCHIGVDDGLAYGAECSNAHARPGSKPTGCSVKPTGRVYSNTGAGALGDTAATDDPTNYIECSSTYNCLCGPAAVTCTPADWSDAAGVSRGSADRGVRDVFDPPEHLLTSFHTILMVKFGWSPTDFTVVSTPPEPLGPPGPRREPFHRGLRWRHRRGCRPGRRGGWSVRGGPHRA